VKNRSKSSCSTDCYIRDFISCVRPFICLAQEVGSTLYIQVSAHCIARSSKLALRLTFVYVRNANNTYVTKYAIYAPYATSSTGVPPQARVQRNLDGTKGGLPYFDIFENFESALWYSLPEIHVGPYLPFLPALPTKIVDYLLDLPAFARPSPTRRPTSALDRLSKSPCDISVLGVLR
jgi:hypothetical protein